MYRINLSESDATSVLVYKSLPAIIRALILKIQRQTLATEEKKECFKALVNIIPINLINKIRTIYIAFACPGVCLSILKGKYSNKAACTYLLKFFKLLGKLNLYISVHFSINYFIVESCVLTFKILQQFHG